MCSITPGEAVQPTSSWPSPAQDYYEGPLRLERHLVLHPPATFAVRVSGDGLHLAGIHDRDVLLIDRALTPRPGALLVVLHDGEHRVGLYRVIDGRAALATDETSVPLTADTTPWGVAVAVIRQLLQTAGSPRG